MASVSVSWNHDPEPLQRSQLRLRLGRIYYTWRRQLQWLASGTKYACYTYRNSTLPYLAFTHQTPLLRKLSQVDMQLQYNKITNLQLAGQTMNGLILKPGEVFSFWKLVGKPTKRKGYLKGMVLCNGRFDPGTGGGLCQLSNLIYWMTLHTPLTVTERWRHNYDVFPDSNRTQPFGSGATVSYNYIDLQIQNNTETDYQLLVWLDDEFLHGAWRCSQASNYQYQVYEQEHIIKAAWWGGYIRSNVLFRKIYTVDGTEVGDEHVCSNQAIMMYQPLLPRDGVN
jgi:vancomycin resistance protein VanW